jgi:hypothetical protein
MKRNIIATLVGTLILWVFQAMSWMASPIHKDALKYTPKQEEVMEVLQRTIPEEGVYSLPGEDPSKDVSYEEMEASSKQHLGKPWVLVFYHSSFKGMSASNMIGGILINLLSVILVVYTLRLFNAHEKSFRAALGIVMILPLFCIFQGMLPNMNWFEFPWHFMKGEIIDVLLGWLLCGMYLAWYMRRGNRVQTN